MEFYREFDDVVKITHYPSGESYAEWTIAPTEELTVEVPIFHWDRFMHVIALDEAARRLGAYVNWFIPYFPFARDDRRRGPLGTMPAQLAIDVLANSSETLLSRIKIVDPHSYVTEVVPHIAQKDVVQAVMGFTDVFSDDPVVVIPDTGARHKALTWAKGMYCVQAEKRRDPETGALSGFEVPDYPFDGRPCVIVDDICDGGGTFMGIAKLLKNQGAGELRLVVTHGLFTNGLEKLCETFNRIVTFGFVQAPHEQLTEISWQALHNFGETQ